MTDDAREVRYDAADEAEVIAAAARGVPAEVRPPAKASAATRAAS